MDVKVRPVIDRWRAIKTYIMLSVEAYLPAERQKKTILEQLQIAVSPFLQSVKNKTRLLVNGELKSTGDVLFSGKSQKSAAKINRHPKRHRDSAAAAVKNDSPHHTLWEPVNFTLFGPDVGFNLGAFIRSRVCPLYSSIIAVPLLATDKLLLVNRLGTWFRELRHTYECTTGP